MAQYDHPAKTQFIQQQHQQDMRGSESIRQESQAIPAQNPLVPANPYISEGMVTINPLSSQLRADCILGSLEEVGVGWGWGDWGVKLRGWCY